MFNKLITKLFLKLNPSKTIISKDDLNDLEQARKDYINLYKKQLYDTRKEYNVKKYVAVEIIPRDYPIEIINDPKFMEHLRDSLSHKLADAIKSNMELKPSEALIGGICYEATIQVVEKETNYDKPCPCNDCKSTDLKKDCQYCEAWAKWSLD